jgi:hypothetical protein
MLGKNVKVTAPQSVRANARTMFEALGATLKSPAPQMDVYVFGDNNVGFQYVPDGEALTAAQMRIAPWLELLVPDVGAATTKLESLGIERIEYFDKEHPYFAAPGGVVFRLARR